MRETMKYDSTPAAGMNWFSDTQEQRTTYGETEGFLQNDLLVVTRMSTAAHIKRSLAVIHRRLRLITA
jgi:hypothetical protein